MRYLLKIFSGPHVGAEVLLPSGTTIIGSGDDCDVVLTDRLIAEHHVEVSITDETIQCRPLGDDLVLVDGKPVGKTVIRPFQFFTIGTTHAAIGPEDKPWPHFDLSDFQLRPPAEEGEQIAETEAPETPEDTPPIDSSEDENQEDAPNQANAEPPRRSFSFRRGPVAIALTLIIANSFLVVFLLGGTDSSDQPLAVQRDQADATLARSIRRFEPYVEIKRDNDRLEITGYVDTDSDRDELIRDVRQIDPRVVIKVRSTQALLGSVRKQLESDGWSSQLHAEAKQPGVMRIFGNLLIDKPETRQRWQKTEDRIRRDIPLKQLLIEFDPPADNAVAKSDSNQDNLRTPILQPESKATIRGPSLPILDVRVSHDKVLTLPDGRQLSIGGRLPDGSRIKEIDLDQVVVRTVDGKLMIIPFGVGG